MNMFTTSKNRNVWVLLLFMLCGILYGNDGTNFRPTFDLQVWGQKVDYTSLIMILLSVLQERIVMCIDWTGVRVSSFNGFEALWRNVHGNVHGHSSDKFLFNCACRARWRTQALSPLPFYDAVPIILNLRPNSPFYNQSLPNDSPATYHDDIRRMKAR